MARHVTVLLGGLKTSCEGFQHSVDDVATLPAAHTLLAKEGKQAKHPAKTKQTSVGVSLLTYTTTHTANTHYTRLLHTTHACYALHTPASHAC